MGVALIGRGKGSLAAISGGCRDGIGMDGEDLKIAWRVENRSRALHLM